MKREEKNRQTKRRIMDGALAEFSRQGYGASSVNEICAAQDISKGIIYHYFDTKDELFLACVEECFDRLTEYMEKAVCLDTKNPQEQMEEYFAARTGFFKENPVYQRLFCEAVVSPPAHLKRQIQSRKQGFDCMNIRILEQLLEPIALRPQITKEEVIELVRQFQDFINTGYQLTDLPEQEFRAQEEKRRRVLDILFYGVVERKDGNGKE